MGKLMMIQKKDDERIEALKQCLHIPKKIDVVRAGLQLLEIEAERLKRMARWKHAAKLVAKSSDAVNKEFQKHSRIKSL